MNIPGNALYRDNQCGFTLAELLIVLAVLGIIATFTIPKVLVVSQNQRYAAIGKETASMISGALQAYSKDNVVSASTASTDLTRYMNYVSIDTTTNVDNHQAQGTLPCSGAVCMKLHNGAMLYTYNNSFAGTASTNAVYFYLDPDGRNTDGTTDGPAKAVVLFLYVNGRITNYGNIESGTTSSYGLHFSCLACDPSWFSWN